MSARSWDSLLAGIEYGAERAWGYALDEASARVEDLPPTLSLTGDLVKRSDVLDILHEMSER